MKHVLRAIFALFVSYAAAQDGPPPPQNFGPDTYSTGMFTGEGTAQPGLTCDGSTPTGFRCSGFLASFDHTLLDVTLAVPPGGAPHSLVVVLHGWGGSKGSDGYLADPFLADGHAVLRYSARGFGDSWGQVNLADVNVELEDLRSIVGQVLDMKRLHLNADAIGVIGVSYGGGQTWLSLLEPFFSTPQGASAHIRAAAPIVPWSDLVYALLPNGQPQFSLTPPGEAKLSFINGLYASGLRTSAARPYPNYPDYLVAWHAWLNANEPNDADPVFRQIRDGVAGYRSIWWRQDFWANAAVNRVAVFQVQGLTDDLFPLPEAKRMLLALQSLDPLYPISSYFGDIGHPRAANKPAERDYVVGLIRQWFAYYLQGLGTEPAHVVRAAITRPRNQAFNPADVITVPSYAALATGALTKDFGGSATLVNPLTDPYSGFVWDPLFMEGAEELAPLPAPPPAAVAPQSLVSFTVGVAELSGGQPLLVAGQPAVSFVATTPSPRVELNVRLFDVAPDGMRELITRGTFVLAGGASNAQVTIPTYGNVWQAAPDHSLRLELSNLDSPYLAPSRLPSVTQISQVKLTLPVRQQ